MTTTNKTRWSGIYVVSDNGHYWLSDDNGGEKYIGTSPPTTDMIERYRDIAVGAQL